MATRDEVRKLWQTLEVKKFEAKRNCAKQFVGYLCDQNMVTRRKICGL